jgi:hypothetical protein
MSCTNPNCNPGCNCNNCCPPVPPPVPPTPPICEGTDCVELYDGACVQYTGPAIPCLSILTNTNLNSIIQTLANNICECCDKTTCVNPMETFFRRFKTTYDFLYAADNSVSFSETFGQFIEGGMIFKKCEHCCPDSLFYLFTVFKDVCDDFKTYIPGLNPEVINTCSNCSIDHSSCATELLTLFDYDEAGVVAEDVCEYGSFNNVSGICELNSIFQELFTYEELTQIMKAIKESSLLIICDLANGNVAIGGYASVKKYHQNYIEV